MSFEGESPQCMTRSLPTASKQHRCCECRGWIEKGEVYERITGVWDGTGITFKTCQDCFNLRRRLDEIERKQREDPIPMGMIEEHLEETDSLDMDEGPDFLRIKLKRGAPIGKRWWPIMKAAPHLWAL